MYTMYNPADIYWDILNDIMLLYYLHNYCIFGLNGLRCLLFKPAATSSSHWNQFIKLPFHVTSEEDPYQCIDSQLSLLPGLFISVPSNYTYRATWEWLQEAYKWSEWRLSFSCSAETLVQLWKLNHIIGCVTYFLEIVEGPVAFTYGCCYILTCPSYQPTYLWHVQQIVLSYEFTNILVWFAVTRNLNRTPEDSSFLLPNCFINVWRGPGWPPDGRVQPCSLLHARLWASSSQYSPTLIKCLFTFHFSICATCDGGCQSVAISFPSHVAVQFPSP